MFTPEVYLQNPLGNYRDCLRWESPKSTVAIIARHTLSE
jgi:hypothetical protein